MYLIREEKENGIFADSNSSAKNLPPSMRLRLYNVIRSPDEQKITISRDCITVNWYVYYLTTKDF